jgi:hypothetical protein
MFNQHFLSSDSVVFFVYHFITKLSLQICVVACKLIFSKQKKTKSKFYLQKTPQKNSDGAVHLVQHKQNI